MYRTEHETMMYRHGGGATDLPDLPGGLLAVACGPGWLVLKAMELLLQLPGGEAAWRDEVRRQAGSSFYGWVYAAVVWGMLLLCGAVLLVV